MSKFSYYLNINNELITRAEISYCYRKHSAVLIVYWSQVYLCGSKRDKFFAFDDFIWHLTWRLVAFVRSGCAHFVAHQKKKKRGRGTGNFFCYQKARVSFPHFATRFSNYLLLLQSFNCIPSGRRSRDETTSIYCPGTNATWLAMQARCANTKQKRKEWLYNLRLQALDIPHFCANAQKKSATRKFLTLA